MNRFENVRLYGTRDDEDLHADLGSAHEVWWDGCNLEPDDPRFPYSVEFIEYTVRAPGDSGDGRFPELWEVIERFADHCGFEALADEYVKLADDRAVIAAYDEFVRVITGKQRFMVADRAVRRCTITFTGCDSDHVPTYTTSEWESLSPPL